MLLPVILIAATIATTALTTGLGRGLAIADRRRLPRARLAATRCRDATESNGDTCGGAAGQPGSIRPVSGAVFYAHNGVELVVQQQSQFCDLWSLRDEWSDTRITFSGPELASLRDALNRLDLAAS
jgi:hypothetical protein